MIVPWRLLSFVDERWPRLAHLLRFGTLNVNTSKHWDRAWSSHGVNGFRATEELASVRSRLLKDVPRGSKVLDVGCGAGELLSLLRSELQCSGWGTDISAVAVALTRAQHFEAQVAALPEIPFPENMFDVVVCTETMEHVSNVSGSLRAIASVLRPGGHFLLTVPDGAVDRESVHIHRFTAATLRDTLAREFRVVAIETIDDPNGRTLLAVAAREAPGPGAA